MITNSLNHICLMYMYTTLIKSASDCLSLVFHFSKFINVYYELVVNIKVKLTLLATLYLKFEPFVPHCLMAFYQHINKWTTEDRASRFIRRPDHWDQLSGKPLSQLYSFCLYLDIALCLKRVVEYKYLTNKSTQYTWLQVLPDLIAGQLWLF